MEQMKTQHPTLEERYAAFKRDGYTVFESVYDDEMLRSFKETFHRLQDNGIDRQQWWFANTCELAPKQMLPAVTNPLILDFAEKVMGPFVQLDNLTLAGFPSVSLENRNKTGWHRDRWANWPLTEDYTSPLSVNAISYLQDLTDEYGPLRVIPGSHRMPVGIPAEERGKPHPDELVLYVKAGDVVFTHNGLIHSGTQNTSGKIRYFYSVYYNKTWLKHTDNHGGPNVQRIVSEARSRNDHRTMRLFGADEQLQARANSGFLDTDEEMWVKWAAADKAAVKG
ncbi:phytanoyl-CoA dioxygenase family protein [Paenibacillus nasutitermitis]|uniref:Phytanoyl-CoA dioxygenase family protein n=1 Tax=Paenibacillus nasutitermitis TaxID=1652958 RepID=A0A917DZH2_9BACL|nr:phytanoyl-CoA dioxygenase family protein [Paenibacillus nasutitermitis]GGD82241.1 hypothetical protein GCM10010911_45440 [Paenibacillus nasutitermitis]